MRRRGGALLMVLLLALYLVLLGQRAVLFILTGVPVAVVLGIALLVLPLLGVWVLVREVLFGIRAEALAGRLADEGGLPQDELPMRPSGRFERTAADSAFPRYKAEVEAEPTDWRTWYRLGLAYDASGDRRRARQAVRNAIRLSRGGTLDD